MSTDASSPEPTALHQALKEAALQSYGSLLAEALADKASSSFADEASSMLETMLAEHTLALRERIEAQLAGMTLGKAKRKTQIKPPAITNGATSDAASAAANGATTNGAAAAEAKPAKAAKTVETKSSRPRKRPAGRHARA
ncbi:MAG: hypothetical protein AAFN74_08040 [Myxococcota bacterium]